MDKTEPVFDLLKSIRMEALKVQDWAVLRAVENAENAAMEEICGVNLNRPISTRNTGGGLVVEWPEKLLQS